MLYQQIHKGSGTAVTESGGYSVFLVAGNSKEIETRKVNSLFAQAHVQGARVRVAAVNTLVI